MPTKIIRPALARGHKDKHGIRTVNITRGSLCHIKEGFVTQAGFTNVRKH